MTQLKIESYDANGALKVSLPTIPDHTHAGGGSGGQLNASSVFSAGAVPITYGGTGQTSASAGFNALAPTGAKGDLVVHNGTTNTNLAAGANYAMLIADSSAASGLAWFNPRQYAILQDQKASGTSGGTSTAASWSTRQLNTEVVDEGSVVTLSSDQFTPITGIYVVTIYSSFVASGSAGHGRLRLRNVTGGTTALTSNNHRMPASASIQMTLFGIFAANGADAYAVQYYVTASRTGDGLGSAMSIAGENEIYTTVTLVRIS